MRRLSVAACVLLLAASHVFGESPVEVGKMAPDFELTGTDGKTYKLSDFKEKKMEVVIAWYPKAKTGG